LYSEYVLDVYTSEKIPTMRNFLLVAFDAATT